MKTELYMSGKVKLFDDPTTASRSVSVLAAYAAASGYTVRNWIQSGVYTAIAGLESRAKTRTASAAEPRNAMITTNYLTTSSRLRD